MPPICSPAMRWLRYAALQPAGADFAEQMLEGSVLRRLDGQTIRESWLQALDEFVPAV